MIYFFLDFETFGKPKNFDKRNELLDKISVVYFIYHLIIISLIASSNAILISECKEENERRGIEEICGMAARLWLPFNYDYFPLKQIIYVYEVNFTLFLFIPLQNDRNKIVT